MEEIIYYSALFDYYGKLITETQQTYFKEYYFNNLTLQEIASLYNVSKNNVSKTLKEVKEKLDNLEKNLMLMHNKAKIKEILSNEEFQKIEKYI